jgi:hypothetical protein
VLMCGDREWDDERIIKLIVRGIAAGLAANVVIEGGARGADTMAGNEADLQGVNHERFPAKWDEHGKAAGPIRNQQMLTEGKPDIVFAFHDNIAASKGTADMVRRAVKAGLPTYVVSRAS